MLSVMATVVVVNGNGENGIDGGGVSDVARVMVCG